MHSPRTHCSTAQTQEQKCKERDTTNYLALQAYKKRKARTFVKGHKTTLSWIGEGSGHLSKDNSTTHQPHNSARPDTQSMSSTDARASIEYTPFLTNPRQVLDKGIPSAPTKRHLYETSSLTVYNNLQNYSLDAEGEQTMEIRTMKDAITCLQHLLLFLLRRHIQDWDWGSCSINSPS